MTAESKTLADLLPEQQARCRELKSEYEKIPTGIFVVAMIEAALTRADRAAISGDTVAILRAYEELKGFE